MYFDCDSEASCMKAFHDMFDGVPWTASVTDLNQKDQPTIYINPAFTVLTGYEWEDIVGRNCRLLQGKDHQQKGVSLLREAIDEGIVGRAKLKNYRKDGTPFCNLVRLVPIKTNNPELRYVLGLQLDISWIDD